MPAAKSDDRPEENPGDQPLRTCPICAKPAVFAFRPFCSKRCADIDLHRWLKGSYAIPVSPSSGDQTDHEDTDTD
jgi:uncharacterized protein